MITRKPMKESTDLANDSVLDGDGADVKTSVLDELATGISEDIFTEDGGEDTAEDLENIDDEDLDALLSEDRVSVTDEIPDQLGAGQDGIDDSKLTEDNPIKNLGDKKAPPFKADDAKEARAKKEAEGDDEKDDKDGDKKAPPFAKGKDGEEDEDKKDGDKNDKDKGDKDLKEDFDDPSEVIDPVLYTDDEPVVEEFGEMPDVVPEYPDEPILELEGDDDYIPDVDIDSGITAPSYDVESSFILPESKAMVVSRGDRIYYCGKAQKNLPSYAESTFAKAAKLLVQSKNLKGAFLAEGKKSERVALVGRSCLVEVARDWRLPGTDTIFEKGDIIQIVSRKPVTEKEVKVK